MSVQCITQEAFITIKLGISQINFDYEPSD